MNCVIYSRVSTNLQDNQRAIDELKKYAEKKDYQLSGVFYETITGASKATDRKAFSELTDFVQKNRVQNILIWEFTRLGRNTADILYTINFFSELKVNIYAYKENLSTLRENGERDPITLLICNILASFSELERDSIKQRSKSGIRANVANGGSGQGIIKAYGYKVVEKKLVIDEDESKIVKLIFDLYLNGNGTTKIAKYLNDNSIPTKYNKTFGDKILNLRRVEKKGTEFHWVDGTVHHILTNPIYKGKRRHGQEFFQIESIVTEQIFDKVQILLKENYNKKGNNRKYLNPLKEKVICGKCGMSYYMHLRNNKKDKAYRCLSKRIFKNCGNPSIGIDKLHNALFQMLKTNMLYEFYSDIEKSIESNRHKISEIEEKLSANQKRINKLQEQKKKLLDLYLDEKINIDDYSSRLTTIQSSISELQIYIIRNTNILESLKIENNTLQEMNIPNFENNKSILEYLWKGEKTDFDNIQFPETSKELYIIAINKYLDKIIINEYHDEKLKTDYFRNKQDVGIRIDIYLKHSNHPTSLFASQRTFYVLKEFKSYNLEIKRINDITYYPINTTINNSEYTKNYMILSDKPNESLSFTNV
jgi:site-specific DNA recombinase